MQKLDLHVTSVPDYKAQTAIAQMIVHSGSRVPMQTAMEMAGSPPILLYRNLEPKAAAKRVNTLKTMGIGFRVSKAEAVPIPAKPIRANIGTSSIRPSDDKTVIQSFGYANQSGNNNRYASATHNASSEYGDTMRTEYYTSSDRQRGELDLEMIKQREEEAKRRNLQFTLVMVTILLIFAMALSLISQREKSPTVTGRQTTAHAKNTPPEKAGSNNNGTGEHTDSRADAALEVSNRLRNQISGKQRQQSNAYVDSAQKNNDNPGNKIAFYKFAISYNRYNLAAWQGLLQAYNDLNRKQEAQETAEQMTAIFGGEIMSVTTLIQQFGKILDAHMSDDGTYRLEYKTNKSKKNDIMLEAFNITRSVRSTYNCGNVSIYASTGSGRGLLAHSTPKTSIHTLSAFSKQAEIIWLN